MCKPQVQTSSAAPVLLGAGVVVGAPVALLALVGPVVFLAMPVVAIVAIVVLAVTINNAHTAPTMSRTAVRPARELEARKRLEAAPARLALESARPTAGVLDGVVVRDLEVAR